MQFKNNFLPIKTHLNLRLFARVAADKFPTRRFGDAVVVSNEPLTTFWSTFTVVFYGQRKFCCKTAQFCVTRRECEMTETPRVRHSAECCDNMRKNSFLN